MLTDDFNIAHHFLNLVMYIIIEDYIKFKEMTLFTVMTQTAEGVMAQKVPQNYNLFQRREGGTGKEREDAERYIWPSFLI